MWCAILLVLLGAALPAPDPANDQQKVSLQAAKISSQTETSLSVREIFELVKKDTGNALHLEESNHTKGLLDKKMDINLEGKTFWEVHDLICETCNLKRVAVTMDGGFRLASTKSKTPRLALSGTPIGEETKGVYRLAYTRRTDHILLQIIPEPRLRHFYSDRLELTVKSGKKSIKIQSTEPTRHFVLVYAFRTRGLPTDIKELRVRGKLLYAYDWRILDLGTLNAVVKKGKPRKMGIQVLKFSSMEEGKDRSGIPTLRVLCEHRVPVDFRGEDFYLVRPRQEESVQGLARLSLKNQWTITFSGLTPGTKSTSYRFWVRAPFKSTKDRLDVTLKL